MRKYLSIILISLIIILNTIPPINTFAVEEATGSSTGYVHQNAKEVEENGVNYESILEKGEATHERKDKYN